MERKQKELKEAEMKRLEEEKGRLKREKKAEDQCMAGSHGAEKVMEQRRAALVVPSPPEAGQIRAPPRQPERTMKGANHGLGIIIPKNCAQCIVWGSDYLWEPVGKTQSCQLCQQLKKPCRCLEEPMMERKWRAEGEGHVGKRWKVEMEEVQEVEGVERCQNKDRGLQLGAEIIEVLWHLNDHLALVEEELAASQEAMMENAWLLCCSLIHNLWRIKMTLEGQRGQEERGVRGWRVRRS